MTTSRWGPHVKGHPLYREAILAHEADGKAHSVGIQRPSSSSPTHVS